MNKDGKTRAKDSELALRPVSALAEAEEAERLAQQAIDFIGRVARRAQLEMMVEIGDHLVENFYGGDLELAHSQLPTKAVALRRLGERVSEIDFPASQLRIAVAMSAQYRALPATVRDRLSVRQYRALLPVQDPQRKSKLARRAVTEKLSGPAISELVRREQGRAPGGRKPLSELERLINAARRTLVSAALEHALDTAELREIHPLVRERLAKETRTLRERVERIADALARVKG